MDRSRGEHPLEKVDPSQWYLQERLKTRPKGFFSDWNREIGRPVSKTSIPRVKPSVDSMAMVRIDPITKFQKRYFKNDFFDFCWSFL